MTEKEKAKELVNIYSEQASMICDELIKESKLHDLTMFQQGRTGYWMAVKREVYYEIMDLL